MVEVFKTNVKQTAESQNIVQQLLHHFPESKINFDLEDCDKILRIEAVHILHNKVIALLKASGYHCEVLAP